MMKILLALVVALFGGSFVFSQTGSKKPVQPSSTVSQKSSAVTAPVVKSSVVIGPHQKNLVTAVKLFTSKAKIDDYFAAFGTEARLMSWAGNKEITWEQTSPSGEYPGSITAVVKEADVGKSVIELRVNYQLCGFDREQTGFRFDTYASIWQAIGQDVKTLPSQHFSSLSGTVTSFAWKGVGFHSSAVRGVVGDTELVFFVAGKERAYVEKEQVDTATLKSTKENVLSPEAYQAASLPVYAIRLSRNAETEAYSLASLDGRQDSLNGLVYIGSTSK